MKSLNQSYTVDLRVNYVFNLFATPDFMGNTRMLSSLIVCFKGLQELDFEPKVDSEHRFAIVPPLLRNECGRGSLVIAEVRKIPLSKRGNKIAEYAIQLMSMIELEYGKTPWEVAYAIERAKSRITDHIIPYMIDIVGFQVIGRAPFYKEE